MLNNQPVDMPHAADLLDMIIARHACVTGES